MSVTTAWISLGAAIGGMQVLSLRHTSNGMTVMALAVAPIRLLVVALLLVLATRYDHLIFAVIGWAVGFFAAFGLLAGRRSWK